VKQQCHISMIYLSWLVYLGGIVVAIRYSHWAIAVVWCATAPVLEWLYIRKLRSFSAVMEYGRITDQLPSAVSPMPIMVWLYTALGCPFCPLIEQRLESLQQTSGFSLQKIDVTLRPDILASKGIRSVPAVEVQGHFLFGLVSAKDLAAAIAQPEPRPAAAEK
jgi:thiol-disulfide isomerase/thioredoxin